MTRIIERAIKAEPFLRWAGGKRWLTNHIEKYLPKNGFNNYHEPFLGGAAIFFHLNPSKKVFLSDLNKELIITYKCIQSNVEDIISRLENLNNTKDSYYEIRNSEPNNAIEIAVRFIFLNYTSFNGIYRVNSNGKYNVPYGYRKSYQINYDNLREVSKRLENVILDNCDFTSIISNINEGDLIFLDPPYTIAHNNNGFVRYNQKIFSLEEQYRLAKTIESIKEKGATYILTNADHDKVKEIFNNGDSVYKVYRSSVVGGKNAKRGKFSELIITNSTI